MKRQNFLSPIKNCIKVPIYSRVIVKVPFLENHRSEQFEGIKYRHMHIFRIQGYLAQSVVLWVFSKKTQNVCVGFIFDAE